jgi:hypothetical protein
MKQIKFLNMQLDKYFVLLMTTVLFISCADFDRNFEDERYLSVSHAEANASAGGTIGLQALDGAILSYLRDGESGTREFGLNSVGSSSPEYGANRTIAFGLNINLN